MCNGGCLELVCLLFPLRPPGTEAITKPKTNRDARRQLEVERKRIDDQLAEKNALIQAWALELESLEHSSDSGKTNRLPRGEAKQRISAFFDTDLHAQADGATIKEIADATGVSWSTVRNVIEKPKNGYSKDPDTARWKRSGNTKLKAVAA